MGLLDFGATVVTRYKVDTSQAKSELRSLSAEERKLAEARIKQQEAANKATEQSAKNWTLAAGAVGAATAAIAIGKSAVEAYGNTSTEAAARVKELGDKFENAFQRGLAGLGEFIMEFEPLFSAIAKGIDKLEDLGAVGAKVGKGLALVTGVGAGAYAANWIAGKFGDDKPQPTGLLQQTWDSKDSIAQAKDFVNLVGKGLNAYATDIGKQYAAQEALKRTAWNESHGIYDFTDAEGMNVGQLRDQAKAAAKAAWEASKARTNAEVKELGDALLERLIADQEARIPDSGIPAVSAGNGFDADVNATMAKFYGAQGEFANRNAAAYGEFRAGKEQSFLESHFGKLSDFDAYATAFTSLTGATTAALDAWIDGSESAGKAFKHFIGDALKGLANQMAVESLKHAAYALGSLAFYDYAGAARHAAAAAAFGAGAGAAAIAARALGTSASARVDGAGGSSATPAAPSSSSSDDRGPRQAIIVYGDPFATDSPRARERQAKQIVETATGNSSWSND